MLPDVKSAVVQFCKNVLSDPYAIYMMLRDKMVAHLIAVTLNIAEILMAAIDSLWCCICLLRKVFEKFATAFDAVSGTRINAARVRDYRCSASACLSKKPPRRYRVDGLGVRT